ncbi:ABC transporter permease subunit [bacterium]|nr:ABC transporter permease subunit [candidate division CSSED10-310 bacterium]
MKTWWTLFKREFASFFVSPVAYVVLAIFLIITGILFYSNLLWYYQNSFGMFQDPYMIRSMNLTDDLIRPLFANISVILMFMIPALTMRLFAEEKRSGTIELLLSYPVRDSEVILGKFSATLTFFVVILLLTLVFPVFLYAVSEPETGPMITAYLGCFLMGASFIAVGTFASSTTENQIIAALLAFGLNLTFWIVGWISPPGTGTMSTVLQYLSIIEHYDPLTQGILNSKDIIYFLSVTVLFLFLTNRVLLSKKWRG